MTDTNQLPELLLEFDEWQRNTPRKLPEHLTNILRSALQARAQVQGAPIGEVGTMPGTSGFTMACFRADEIPVGTPLYTTPQPAHATQAEVTDADIDAVTIQQWGDQRGAPLQAHRAYARAILALRPVQSGLTGCNCRWDGDTQVQWCELHLAHKEAIHEWAERAKEAEKQLALRPAAVPMTDEVFDLICNAIDKADTISMEGDYMLDSDDCIAVVRVMQALLSAHHGITAQAKKETP